MDYSKKRQNPKTRQNRDNTRERQKVGVQKGGVQKNQLSTKQIYINETTQKLKHLQICHAREVLYVVN